jgi:hypothetical protein
MTSRRSFLTTAAAGAAGLAAVPAFAIPADPVFAAIDAHAQAMQEVNRLIVDGPWDRAVQDAATRNEFRTGEVLIGTAPTTRAGLLALAAHLRDERSAPAVFVCIARPAMIATGRLTPVSYHVEALIAKRAAALA